TKQLAEAAAAVVTEAGVPVSTLVSSGDASGVLIDASTNADLAVVGARGHGGFSGRLLGSVALAMPAHAHCPTVVIPTTWPERPPHDEHNPIE
ncbi:universal stress protein, partial [Mycobacterium tuberculosis]|nr:universal stress protein [Mycobacterium tuberculosis]